MDPDSGEVLCYWDHTPSGPGECPPRAGALVEGVKAIQRADRRYSHNGLAYDEPVLRRLGYAVPPTTDHAKVRDTIVGARVIWPEENLGLIDFLRRKKLKLGKQFEGFHSLEAWGVRLGIRKGDFGKQGDWSTFTVPMLLYCIQDVKVTAVLLRLLDKKAAEGFLPDSAWVLEQQFAERMQAQMRWGFPFDRVAAEKLAVELMAKKLEQLERCAEVVPPFVVKYVTPKKKIEKTKTIKFNPGSRHHIAKYLQSLGWKPDKKTGYTPSGDVKIDESVLEHLDYPAVDEIKMYMLLQKRLAALSEGQKSWLKLVQKDGRIYGKVQHNAAGTSRCTHSGPNVTQVPKAGKKKDGSPVSLYGHECRSLFGAFEADDDVLVGADASGIELRGVAHYMSKFDNGEYSKLVLEGDPHERNRVAAGLPSRDMAKTFYYALVYGAGDEKLGRIMGSNKAAGRAARARLMANLPAFAALLRSVQWIDWKDIKPRQPRKFVRALDGRMLMLRSPHSALNTLLQGFGAIVMKYANVRYDQILTQAGLPEGPLRRQVCFAHDEIQCVTKKQYAEQVGKALVQAIEDAGVHFKLRIPLAGEYRIGKTWAQTH